MGRGFTLSMLVGNSPVTASRFAAPFTDTMDRKRRKAADVF